MGWGGLRVKNILREEIRRWIHCDAKEVKSERNAEIIELLEYDSSAVENEMSENDSSNGGESSDSD